MRGMEVALPGPLVVGALVSWSPAGPLLGVIDLVVIAALAASVVPTR